MLRLERPALASMGSGISKSMKVDPDIKYKEPKKLPSGFNSKRLDERELLDVVSGMFDAHAHHALLKPVYDSASGVDSSPTR